MQRIKSNAFKCTAHAHARVLSACINSHNNIQILCKWQHCAILAYWQITIAAFSFSFLLFHVYFVTRMNSDGEHKHCIKNIGAEKKLKRI